MFVPFLRHMSYRNLPLTTPDMRCGRWAHKCSPVSGDLLERRVVAWECCMAWNMYPPHSVSGFGVAPPTDHLHMEWRQLFVWLVDLVGCFWMAWCCRRPSIPSLGISTPWELPSRGLILPLMSSRWLGTVLALWNRVRTTLIWDNLLRWPVWKTRDC